MRPSDRVVTAEEISETEQKIGYTFADKQLLLTCFTHSTYANVHKTESNERLEFLGDALLDFLAGEYLYRQGGMNEGEMTKRRIEIVSKLPLEKAVHAMNIEYLRFSGNRQNLGKKSVSSLFEAVLAGIYLDGGEEEAKKFVREKLLPYAGFEDYISRINELYPHGAKYEECGRTGKDHRPHYIMRVTVGDKSAMGEGASKDSAMRDAAKNFLHDNTTGREEI